MNATSKGGMSSISCSDESNEGSSRVGGDVVTPKKSPSIYESGKKESRHILPRRVDEDEPPNNSPGPGID